MVGGVVHLGVQKAGSVLLSKIEKILHLLGINERRVRVCPCTGIVYVFRNEGTIEDYPIPGFRGEERTVSLDPYALTSQPIIHFCRRRRSTFFLYTLVSHPAVSDSSEICANKSVHRSRQQSGGPRSTACAYSFDLEINPDSGSDYLYTNDTHEAPGISYA